jgi:hypothetical protein
MSAMLDAVRMLSFFSFFSLRLAMCIWNEISGNGVTLYERVFSFSWSPVTSAMKSDMASK